MSRIEDMLQGIIDGADPSELPAPQSRVEGILEGILEGTDVSDMPAPQSRVEALLLGVLDKINKGGGGGGGLVYETGEYKPAADIARPTISFAESHTNVPIFVGMADVSGQTGTQANDNLIFMWFDYYKLFGTGVPYNSSTTRYATDFAAYRTTSGMGAQNNHVSYSSDDPWSGANSYARYWVTEKEFKPYSNSDSRVWRTGRTYKWIAVWAPEA